MLLSLIVGHLIPGGLTFTLSLCHSYFFLPSLSLSFNQKAVLLCDISVECPTTGVNYSNIKLTIVSHLIQMFCFNKEPFKDMEYILRLLKLEHLNKTWQRPLIKRNKAEVRHMLSSCHWWAITEFDRLVQDSRGSHTQSKKPEMRLKPIWSVAVKQQVLLNMTDFC